MIIAGSFKVVLLQLNLFQENQFLVLIVRRTKWSYCIDFESYDEKLDFCQKLDFLTKVEFSCSSYDPKSRVLVKRLTFVHDPQKWTFLCHMTTLRPVSMVDQNKNNLFLLEQIFFQPENRFVAVSIVEGIE